MNSKQSIAQQGCHLYKTEKLVGTGQFSLYITFPHQIRFSLMSNNFHSFPAGAKVELLNERDN